MLFSSVQRFIFLYIKIIIVISISLLSQASLAAGSYTYSADGSEVTDTVTGLIWRRCSEGTTWNGSGCTGTAVQYSHEGALIQASNQAGWRLPNIKELSSLINRLRVNPAIDTTAFPSTQDGYWSSTAKAGISTSAWGVQFINGNLVYVTRPLGLQQFGYIRLVK